MSPRTIAVDAMGGDLAPGATVSGAIEAARAGVPIVLVGAEATLAAELDRQGDRAGLPIEIVDAPDVVRMDESPLAALRRKPRTSVKVAVDLVHAGAAGACLSAGHTGATVLAAHAELGMLPGAERPALAVTVPTESGRAVLIDAGANAECRAQHLLQFGVMGSAYARVVLDRAEPRVGLLSIGEEAGKGNDLTRDAHALLAASGLPFVGNLEARELFTGRADVVVCDGFTGNVALKVGEGLAEMIERALRHQLQPVLTTVPAVAEMFEKFTSRLDATEYGAVPLLGVSGLVLVAHGRSTAVAIRNGIATAARLVDAGVTERLAAELRPSA